MSAFKVNGTETRPSKFKSLQSTLNASSTLFVESEKNSSSARLVQCDSKMTFPILQQLYYIYKHLSVIFQYKI